MKRYRVYYMLLNSQEVEANSEEEARQIVADADEAWQAEGSSLEFSDDYPDGVEELGEAD